MVSGADPDAVEPYRIVQDLPWTRQAAALVMPLACQLSKLVNHVARVPTCMS